MKHICAEPRQRALFSLLGVHVLSVMVVTSSLLGLYVTSVCAYKI